jgi:hypothetical protein
MLWQWMLKGTRDPCWIVETFAIVGERVKTVEERREWFIGQSYDQRNVTPDADGPPRGERSAAGVILKVRRDTRW